MARFEFKLPDIGEGVTEGEIVTWLVEVGDTVSENQDIVEVMTDKATVTIGSPKSGRILELGGAAGSTLPVGHVLAVVEVQGDEEAGAPYPPSVSPEPAAPSSAPGAIATAVGDLQDELPGLEAERPRLASGAEPAAEPASIEGSSEAPPTGAFERPVAAPATRKLARDLGVSLADVQPSGQAGRITKEDIERHLARRARPVPAPERAAPEPVSAVAAPMPSAGVPSVGERRVPIRGLRRRIYDNMARAKRTAAHFTYVDECDVSELVALRERLKAHAETQQVRLSYLPFIVKAVTVALKRHPGLNCLVDDARLELVLRESADIGIATATEAGLIVPVLRRADQLSLLDIAREIDRLAVAARQGKTRPEDLGGSSFTITSLGKLGGFLATPVVNYPEVAILGVHEIKRRPVVRGQSIAIGDIMMLSLSFDHRVIDGDVGAAFAKEIKACLEQPDRLILAMS